MRTLALAAVCGVGLLAGGIAAAEQWNDPGGRLTFNAPAGWRVQPQNSSGQNTVVLAFNPTNDCYFFGVPNPATANSSAEAARTTTAALPASAWISSAAPISDFFAGAPPTLVSQTVDTTGFWPVQRAELRGPTKTVYGAILARPGTEIRAFCSGAASAAAYDAIFASLGHPNDATWQQAATEQRSTREAAAQAAQQAADQAAAAAAAAAAQQEEQQQRNRRREGRGSRN
ncbi:MAG: hypothetical protein JNL81_03530 [Hyphomonadaceae bacterium]|nr:hypothetical protein [Hyphomonadaceae bacterium]